MIASQYNMSQIISFTPIELQANKERFIELLKRPYREGTEKLIAYLEKTDFFEAPASSKFHNNLVGGLCAHSLNVYDMLDSVFFTYGKKFNINGIKGENLIITSLLHDVCKANYYVQKTKFRKNDQDRWENYLGWEIDEKLPLGHGEKSIAIIIRFIELTTQEMLAIRWHMGPWEIGIQLDRQLGEQYRKACDYPFIKLFQLADNMAEMSEKRYEL